MNPIVCTDYYKTEHFRMYPENTTMIYSNLTPRKSRLAGVDSVVVFGIQHFIKKYLIDKFNEEFFNCLQNVVVDQKPYPADMARYEGEMYDVVERRRVPRSKIIKEYSYAINTSTKHIEALWDLGYLPLEIKALPEGSRCPIRVPCMTIRNTHPDFYWLTNYLETLISCQLWQPMTSATIAAEYWKILSKYAKETTNSTDFVQWQAHDFSMRGMSSLESAILSGMGHLTSFTGTDTIPAIYALKQSYGGEGLIGASVPATEHSVMCMGTKDDEVGTFARLISLYPTGILSVVSDTWDLWKVLTEYLPALKDTILRRDGKLVIRPDSGDPVDIICGTNSYLGPKPISYFERYKHAMPSEEEEKGVIELLWDVFGGTIIKGGDGNDYKQLDSHIGAIYGDSITLDRATQICERLKAKGFASTNIVFGVGSYTYQYNTRDTFGFAMKATYGELEEPYESDAPWITAGETVCIGREIWKDPVTDDGTKKSAKGLIRVVEENYKYMLEDQQSWDMENTGCLETVFMNGKLKKQYTLEDIRKRIKQSI